MLAASYFFHWPAHREHLFHWPARGLASAAATNIAADDGISTLEGPALLEYAMTCNDPSGFEVRRHVGEAHKKTRHPDDCEATQTGSPRGWNEARQLFDYYFNKLTVAFLLTYETGSSN